MTLHVDGHIVNRSRAWKLSKFKSVYTYINVRRYDIVLTWLHRTQVCILIRYFGGGVAKNGLRHQGFYSVS